MPLISVVVPVYNVEQYLAKCLDSLLSQDIDIPEIIIVNDGSEDRSVKIAESYVKRHPSIKFISQDNKGLSAARNVGMQAASGKYIGFMDSDDWAAESMYRTLLNAAEATQADLVIGNGQLYDDHSGELRPFQDFRIWRRLKNQNDSLVYQPPMEPDLFILDTQACKRLYRMEFLRDLGFQFPEGKIFEDVATHYTLLLSASRVALVDEPLYFYRTNRPDRITARTDRTLFQIFDALHSVMDALRDSESGPFVWANFIWFQSWVLRWLRQQVDTRFREEFDAQIYTIGERFGPDALRVFDSCFVDDSRARDFVKQEIHRQL